MGAVMKADGDGVFVSRGVKADHFYGPAFHLREFHDSVVRQPSVLDEVIFLAGLGTLWRFPNHQLWRFLAAPGLFAFSAGDLLPFHRQPAFWLRRKEFSPRRHGDAEKTGELRSFAADLRR